MAYATVEDIADNTLTAIEVKAHEWLELGEVLGYEHGFIGELVVSLINEGRENEQSPEEISMFVSDALADLARAALDFRASAKCEIGEA